MKINWKLRLQNKYFWISMISAIFAFLTAVLPLFGVTANLTGIQEAVMTALTMVFTVLTALGIVIDPTTEGASDSKRALGYDEPAPNVKSTEEMEPEVEAFLENEGGGE